MHSSLIAWIMRAIPFGTIIMYGALGETVTEKSGNLNLGVPGIMYLGGFAGFASAWAYENSAANPNGAVSIIIAMTCAILASMAGGLIYAFLTISLRANQNVTGLALTTFGMGVANFFGVFILNGASYSAAPVANKAFSAKIPVLSGLGDVGQVVFSYGFLVYAAIALAILMHWFLTRTRAGLNLRAVGENPATADAAGINVTLYKYLATCIGAGICGIGGLYYVLDYNQGIWATTGQIEALGWLAVALVIFTTWKPLNAIWGAYLFGMLYWLYQFLPTPHHRLGADAALRRDDRRADRGFDAQEKGKPTPRTSGVGIFPRGAVKTKRHIHRICRFFHAFFIVPTHLKDILNFVKIQPDAEGNPVWLKQQEQSAVRWAGSKSTKSSRRCCWSSSLWRCWCCALCWARKRRPARPTSMCAPPSCKRRA